MKSLYQHTLKGNTIIEVLIALAILSFISALSVVIYLNIQKSSTPFFKMKALELAENYISQTIEKKDFSDSAIEVDEFELKRKISSISNLPDCILLRVLVYTNSKKKIFEIEQIIYSVKGEIY